MRTLAHERDAFVVAGSGATAEFTSTGGLGRAFFVVFVAAKEKVYVRLSNPNPRTARTTRRRTTGDLGKKVAIEPGYRAS